MYKEPILKFNLEGLEEATKETIKNIVNENIINKMDTQLKKIYHKNNDIQVTFEIKIFKNKKGKYNGVFIMDYPGIKEALRYEREDFENLYDLINHAFANFKERLSGGMSKFKKFLNKLGFGK